jgi:hypothetical protein
MSGFPLSEQARFNAWGRRHLEQHFKGARRIDDKHTWSRRSRSSRGMGRSALRRISVRRYAERDMPSKDLVSL